MDRWEGGEAMRFGIDDEVDSNFLGSDMGVGAWATCSSLAGRCLGGLGQVGVGIVSNSGTIYVKRLSTGFFRDSL